MKKALLALATIALSAAAQTPPTVNVDFGNRSGATPAIPANLLAIGALHYIDPANIHLITDANIKQSRMFISMDQIYYHSNTPNFKSLDIYLTRMQSEGLSGIAVLTGTPATLGAKFCTAPDPKKWTAFAVAVVKHINTVAPGVITGFEIWNEPDAVATLCPPDLNTYLGLYATAAPAIKALGVKVGGPTLAIPAKNLNWISALITNPTTAPFVDFVSYHTYITGQWNIDKGMKWADLFAATHDSLTGLAQYYNTIEAMVRSGKQPNAATTPIYMTEYNTNWAFALDCCRNDPTFAPLWNSLAIIDELNTVYHGAKQVPSQMIYFNATIKYFCVIGKIDSAMDCAQPGTDLYPQFNALGFFATKLNNGGNMAESIVTTGQIIATAFYTKDADYVVMLNPTPNPIPQVNVSVQNAGFTNYSMVQVESSQGQLSIPAYSTTTITINPKGLTPSAK